MIYNKTMDKEVFNHILDSDEQIVDVFKPSRFVFVLTQMVPYTFFVAVLALIACLGSGLSGMFLLIPIGVALLVEIILIIILSISYGRILYAVTNKRLIIRSGVIGVDYRTLDLKMIGYSDVQVSFLDKLAKNGTGSLRFGSMSSPVNSRERGFVFSHIPNAYENYKKVKELIEASKN